MAESRDEWPAWWYGPEGAKQIFNSPDEVPEGWEDHPSKLKGQRAKQSAPPPQGGAQSLAQEQRSAEMVKKAVDELVDKKSQAELVAIIEKINDGLADDEKLEFLAGWPKAKLATVIVEFQFAQPNEEEE